MLIELTTEQLEMLISTVGSKKYELEIELGKYNNLWHYLDQMEKDNVKPC